MKKNLLNYILSIALIVASFGGLAQSDGNKSRLNVGKKKDPLTRTIGNSRIGIMRQNGLDRGLTVKQSTAISNFYKSLMTSSGTGAPVQSTRAKAAESSAPVLNDGKSATDEILRIEDRLFANDKITVSNIYPNPSTEYAEIDYSVSGSFTEAKIVIYNMLGSTVNEHELDRSERKVKISTRDMANGIYFYQLSLDGKKVATKKLLVRHQ